MKISVPKVEDIITYEGEDYRVLTLLASQFVAECISMEKSNAFIFYKDPDWRIK